MLKFKNYLNSTLEPLQEGIIIPDKLKIVTTNIKKLNKQFQNTIISFEEVDSEEEVGGSYIPATEEIIINVYKNMSLNTLEALINHEIIHSIQDDKSSMRMEQELNAEYKKIENLVKKLDSLNSKSPEYNIVKAKLDKSSFKHLFGTHQEKMTYSYMFVKMAKDKNLNTPDEVVQEAEKWLNIKLDKQFKKYIGMYWMVRNEL